MAMTKGLCLGVTAMLLLSACAEQKVVSRPSPPPAAEPAQKPPEPVESKEPAVHGHRRGAMVFRDGKTGATLSKEALGERLQKARAIYVGEQHNSFGSHAAELSILGQTYAQSHDLALGIEMLPRRLQPQIDAFLAGSIDEEGFLHAVDWDHTWGFDYGFYRPIFEFCRIHGLRIHGLNAPKELSRALRQRGIEGLTPDEKALLPSGHPWPAPEPHRNFIRQVFDSHPGPPPGTGTAAAPARDAAFERFYTAQLLWDETMAQSVAEILAKPAAPAHLVVLAGVGHVGPYAVPGRATRRGVASSLTVGPVEKPTDPPPEGAEAVDVLAVVGVDNPHGHGQK